jgi:hypothetical protein
MGHSIGLMPTTYYGVDIMPGDWQGRWPNELSEEEYEKYAEQYYSIMNYGYIFGITREQILCFDYSDGSNSAPYDQNDWAHIYLPAFQTEQASYEEAKPTIDETFEDMEIIKKERDVVLDGWMFDKNLSMKHASELSELTHISNADCAFRVLVKQKEDTEEQISIRNVRIFARPIVEPVVTVWTLVAEGDLNEEKNKIKFHSFDEQYANLMSTIQ